MKSDLATITARISKLIKVREASDYELAGLVLEAKEHHFVGDALGWLAWCESNWQFARRHCFALAKVGAFMRDLLANHPDFSARAALKFEHAYEIAVIPSARAMEFLAAHPGLDKMDRDEVREAVRIFLGRKPADKAQQDFFSALGFPDPTKLATMTSDKGAVINPATSAHYAFVFLSATMHRKDSLAPSDRRTLVEGLCQSISELTGHDAAALIKHYTRNL